MSKKVGKNNLSKEVEEILKLLQSLKLEQLLEFEEHVRENYNISDVSLSSGDNQQAKVEEGESSVLYNLVLKGVGELTKIECIKLLNSSIGMEVSKAKEVVFALPYKLLEKVPKAQAEETMNSINEVRLGLKMLIEKEE